MQRRKAQKNVENRWLDINEVRLVSDLRIMHSKVEELFQIVSSLKKHHSESAIRKYADHERLRQDIQRVDDIYLWFVNLKDVRNQQIKLG